MTLIQGIIRQNHSWLCTDNRVSVNNKFRDDNHVKHVGIKCPDGTALLAYTGLAELLDSTKISDWVRSVIRGEIRNVEQTIHFIAESATKEISNYYPLIFVVSAFINKKAYLFEVKNVKDRNSLQSPLKEFTILKTSVDKSLYFSAGSGSGSISSSERLRIAKIIGKPPRKIKDFQNLLITINQKVSKADKERVSESCVAVDMPMSGEPVNSVVKNAGGEVVVPFVIFGVDMTGTMEVLSRGLSKNEDSRFPVDKIESNKRLKEMVTPRVVR
jgi:hypothetical protein